MSKSIPPRQFDGCQQTTQGDVQDVVDVNVWLCFELCLIFQLMAFFFCVVGIDVILGFFNYLLIFVSDA